MDPAAEGIVVRHGDVEVVRARGPDAARAALAFLDRVGADVDAPVVDEAERDRVLELAEGSPTPGHQTALIRRGGVVLGYLGVRAGGSDTARGDLALAPSEAGASGLAAGLEAAIEFGREGGARRLEVWLRRVDDVVDRAAELGFVVGRRLAVLGRSLEGPPAEAPVPGGVVIRGSRPDDEQAIVRLLAEAYAGTAEAGWDLAAFRARQAYDWFDPADLLVAVDGDDGIAGLHWTKRRSDTVGEVYNLAVAPRAQGCGLGRALLTAGLAHLHLRGADEVLLWVDTANEPAVELYRSHGFRIRWEDVALEQELPGVQASLPGSPRRPGGTTL